MISNDKQWYLTESVGEIFKWYKYPCYVNDISLNLLVRYFCGASDTSGTSGTNYTANSSDASKTSAPVTRLSSYFQ